MPVTVICVGKLRERYNAQKKAMDAAKRPAGTQTE